MTTAPEPGDGFALPQGASDASVWADRAGTRSLVGHNMRGVEIPIGAGEGEIDPGELLRLALIGCAGMSIDQVVGRRLGEDFAMRLWVHDGSDPATNRFPEIHEQIQLDLEGLDAAGLERLRTVIDRAIEARCTVQRTVVPGVPVDHTVIPADAAADPAPASGTPVDPDPTEEGTPDGNA